MPKRIPATKQAQRATVAKRTVQGAPVAAIATELGISRRSVYNELERPETKELIQSWMRPHHESIKRMIPRALAAVNKGLKPSNEMRDRLAAVKTLGNVMEWTEGRKDDGNNGTPLRWQGQLEELLVLYRSFTVKGPEA